jgi:hypothetical protein
VLTAIPVAGNILVVVTKDGEKYRYDLIANKLTQ